MRSFRDVFVVASMDWYEPRAMRRIMRFGEIAYVRVSECQGRYNQ